MDMYLGKMTTSYEKLYQMKVLSTTTIHNVMYEARKGTEKADISYPKGFFTAFAAFSPILGCGDANSPSHGPLQTAMRSARSMLHSRLAPDDIPFEEILRTQGWVPSNMMRCYQSCTVKITQYST
jgi:hypothetical protein